MATATAKVPNSTETVEIDQTGVIDYFNKKMKELEEKLKTPPKDPQGKGVIEARVGSNASKLIEQLRNVRDKGLKITEQWSIAIPAYTAYETAAHMRDYVFVTDVTKGQPGDHVHIPYVKDFDFQVLTNVGDAFTTQTTGIVNATSTTLKEAGAWSDIAYEDIEKIDQNLLDEINRTFAHAAVRAEDKVLIELVSAATGGTFAGQVNRSTATYKFYANNIPEAIGLLIQAGKEVHPGDCVLYINAIPYSELLKELAASQIIAFARGDIITKGVIEEYLGVKIVVGGEVESFCRTAGATKTCQVAFLMRGKRALALAPKRDILIETDRQIATRKLRITGSHTFGGKLLDPKECVRIFCNTADGTAR